MIALLRLFDALILIGPLYAPGFRTPWRFRDTMRYVIHRVEPGHVLFLQIIYSVAFALREHGNENVCAGHFLSTGRLNVNRCALQYALKACCRLCVVTVDGYEVAEFIINVVQDLAAQPLEVDA